MRRQQVRVRIDDEGTLEVVDPSVETLGLLDAIDPGFAVRTSSPWPQVPPRFLALRETGCGVDAGCLDRPSLSELWGLHRSLMEQRRIRLLPPRQTPNEASVLDLKIELARRLLENCQLCGHRCGVDRTRGELGRCELGTEATVADCFVHTAEEPPINPSLNLNLFGCGLRCRHCQQWELLFPGCGLGWRLGPELWNQLEADGARSLSFNGGNPDESLYAILSFLRAAPPEWSLPVVWKNHLYIPSSSVQLLEGVVDCYLPDFKYGAALCGQRLSNVLRYPETAKAAITAMVAQAVPVIVRILVLPGHVECCHLPVLEQLAALERESLAEHFVVSLRDQYCPDWQISHYDGEMVRRVSAREMEAVRSRANQLGLRLVE